MSQFLGPIHYRMFDKVWSLERRTRMLALLGVSTLLDKVTDSCGEIAEGALDEIIDLSNIHGWLSEQVNRAECRYANVVHELLAQGLSLESLEEAERAHAGAYALPENEGLQKAFTELDTMFLDGMPCDRGIAISASSDVVRVIVQEDAHAPFWDLGTPISVYERLRLASMEAAAKKLGITIERDRAFAYSIREAE